jgi:hypothetical protein
MAIGGMYSRFFFDENTGLAITDHGQTSDSDPTKPIGDITIADPVGAVWGAKPGFFTPAETNTFISTDAGLDALLDLNTGGGGLLVLFNCEMSAAQSGVGTVFQWGEFTSNGFIRILQTGSNNFTASITQRGGTELSFTSQADAAMIASNNIVVALSVDVSAGYPSASLAIIFPDADGTGLTTSLSREAPLKLDGTGWPSIAQGNCALSLFRGPADDGMNSAGAAFGIRDLVIKRYTQADNLYQLRGRIAGEMLFNYTPFDPLYLGNYTNV